MQTLPWTTSEMPRRHFQGLGKISEGDGGAAILDSLQGASSGVLDKLMLGHQYSEKKEVQF